MKIFVARLPYQYQEAQIADLFAAYGTVNSVNLIMDRETGRSKQNVDQYAKSKGTSHPGTSKMDY